MENTIKFTEESFKAFKVLHHNATERDIDVFIFEGNEVFVGYAKYMIMYVEGL